MKSAPVSKLTAMRSEFLANVKTGEEVIITERGKPIAKNVPLAAGNRYPSTTPKTGPCGPGPLGIRQTPS